MINSNRLVARRKMGIKKLVSKGLYHSYRVYIDKQERCENYYVADDETGDKRGDW